MLPVWWAKEGYKGFCPPYITFQQSEDIEAAILEEKRLKKWNRDWKIRLIEKNNPEWRDLYPDIL